MRVALLSRNSSLYSTSRLVLAARARGHAVEVVDPLEVQLVVAPRQPRLRRAGKRLPPYDVVIPRIGASITGHGTTVLRQLERRRAPILNRADPIALARDQIRALALLARHRLLVPRTVCTKTLAGLEQALSAVGGCPVIVKLPQGTQGVGTMLAETPQALHALLETLWAMGQEIVLQEFVRESRGSDVRALVVGGRLVAAMRRQAQPGEFRANLHRGGSCERTRLGHKAAHTAICAARCIGLDVAGVDLLRSRRGTMVLEINSSPGLEGIERTTEVDVARAIIELAERRVAVARRRTNEARP